MSNMWWEALPPLGIMFVALALPQYIYHYGNLLYQGNAYRRDIILRWHRGIMERDTRLTGDPYVMQSPNQLPMVIGGGSHILLAIYCLLTEGYWKGDVD